MIIEKQNDFLYYININSKEIDYNYAIQYLKELFFYKELQQKSENKQKGVCTSIRNGHLFARNLDWYENSNIYVINTHGENGKYSSIGVGIDISELFYLENTKDKEKFEKILPFFILDGVNEKGLAICLNYNPDDFGKTYGTNENEEGDYINLQMLPRYTLDNFASVKELINWLQTKGKVYAKFNKDGTNQEYHFFVADKNDTYAIEFANNEVKVTDLKDKPYLTNFHVYNTKFEQDGTVDYKNVSNYANGIERYNICAKNYVKTSDIIGMQNVLTKCYCSNMSKESTNPIWYSEFMYIDHSLDIKTLLTNKEKYTPVIEENYRDYKERMKNNQKNSFYTLYSSIYNIENKSLSIVLEEENNKKFDFSM